MKHATTRHIQPEAYKDQFKIIASPLPLNSIPLPVSNASKNSSIQHHDASSEATGCLAICEAISAGSGSLGAHAEPVHSSRDVSCIAPFLSLHVSVKDEVLASLTRKLIDCVTRTDYVSFSNDVEIIKQLIDDIDNVIENFSSLCKSKDLHIIFNEMSHIADVSTDRLGNKLS